LIAASKHIQCAIGGGNGGLEHDWAAVAAEQAIKAGRKVALLTDAVSATAIAVRADAARGLTALPRRLKSWLVRRWQHRLIARCDLLFCNGLETYRAFAPVCRSPETAQKFNDYQIGFEKYLGSEAMEGKCSDALLRTEVRVCHAGRVEPQNAPRSVPQEWSRCRSGSRIWKYLKPLRSRAVIGGLRFRAIAGLPRGSGRAGKRANQRHAP
jgi:hypothetical protein